MKKNKILLSILLILTFIITFTSSLAVFTDRETAIVETETGFVDLVLDVSNMYLGDTVETFQSEIQTFVVGPDVYTVDINNTHAFPLSFTVENIGNKAALCKATIAISVFDTYYDSIAINETAPEFKLYTADAVIVDPEFIEGDIYKWILTEGDLSSYEITPSKVENNIIYFDIEFILSANPDLDKYETVDGYSNFYQCPYYLSLQVPEEETSNWSRTFAISEVLVEGKQYYNSYNIPWSDLQTENLQTDHNSYNTVPKY